MAQGPDRRCPEANTVPLAGYRSALRGRERNERRRPILAVSRASGPTLGVRNETRAASTGRRTAVARLLGFSIHCALLHLLYLFQCTVGRVAVNPPFVDSMISSGSYQSLHRLRCCESLQIGTHASPSTCDFSFATVQPICRMCFSMSRERRSFRRRSTPGGAFRWRRSP